MSGLNIMSVDKKLSSNRASFEQCRSFHHVHLCSPGSRRCMDGGVQGASAPPLPVGSAWPPISAHGPRALSNSQARNRPRQRDRHVTRRRNGSTIRPLPTWDCNIRYDTFRSASKFGHDTASTSVKTSPSKVPFLSAEAKGVWYAMCDMFCLRKK